MIVPEPTTSNNNNNKENNDQIISEDREQEYNQVKSSNQWVQGEFSGQFETNHIFTEEAYEQTNSTHRSEQEESEEESQFIALTTYPSLTPTPQTPVDESSLWPEQVEVASTSRSDIRTRAKDSSEIEDFDHLRDEEAGPALLLVKSLDEQEEEVSDVDDEQEDDNDNEEGEKESRFSKYDEYNPDSEYLSDPDFHDERPAKKKKNKEEKRTDSGGQEEISLTEENKNNIISTISNEHDDQDDEEEEEEEEYEKNESALLMRENSNYLDDEEVSDLSEQQAEFSIRLPDFGSESERTAATGSDQIETFEVVVEAEVEAEESEEEEEEERKELNVISEHEKVSANESVEEAKICDADKVDSSCVALEFCALESEERRRNSEGTSDRSVDEGEEEEGEVAEASRSGASEELVEEHRELFCEKTLGLNSQQQVEVIGGDQLKEGEKEVEEDQHEETIETNLTFNASGSLDSSQIESNYKPSIDENNSTNSSRKNSLVDEENQLSLSCDTLAQQVTASEARAESFTDEESKTITDNELISDFSLGEEPNDISIHPQETSSLNSLELNSKKALEDSCEAVDESTSIIRNDSNERAEEKQEKEKSTVKTERSEETKEPIDRRDSCPDRTVIGTQKSLDDVNSEILSASEDEEDTSEKTTIELKNSEENDQGEHELESSNPLEDQELTLPEQKTKMLIDLISEYCDRLVEQIKEEAFKQIDLLTLNAADSNISQLSMTHQFKLESKIDSSNQQQFNVGDIMTSHKRKIYTSSMYYNDKLNSFPTIEQQVERCRFIAKQLEADLRTEDVSTEERENSTVIVKSGTEDEDSANISPKVRVREKRRASESQLIDLSSESSKTTKRASLMFKRRRDRMSQFTLENSTSDQSMGETDIQTYEQHEETTKQISKRNKNFDCLDKRRNRDEEIVEFAAPLSRSSSLNEANKQFESERRRQSLNESGRDLREKRRFQFESEEDKGALTDTEYEAPRVRRRTIPTRATTTPFRELRRTSRHVELDLSRPKGSQQPECGCLDTEDPKQQDKQQAVVEKRDESNFKPFLDSTTMKDVERLKTRSPFEEFNEHNSISPEVCLKLVQDLCSTSSTKTTNEFTTTETISTSSSSLATTNKGVRLFEKRQLESSDWIVGEQSKQVESLVTKEEGEENVITSECQNQLRQAEWGSSLAEQRLMVVDEGEGEQQTAELAPIIRHHSQLQLELATVTRTPSFSASSRRVIECDSPDLLTSNDDDDDDDDEDQEVDEVDDDEEAENIDEANVESEGNVILGTNQVSSEQEISTFLSSSSYNLNSVEVDNQDLEKLTRKEKELIYTEGGEVFDAEVHIAKHARPRPSSSANEVHQATLIEWRPHIMTPTKMFTENEKNFQKIIEDEQNDEDNLKGCIIERKPCESNTSLRPTLQVNAPNVSDQSKFERRRSSSLSQNIQATPPFSQETHDISNSEVSHHQSSVFSIRASYQNLINETQSYNFQSNALRSGASGGGTRQKYLSYHYPFANKTSEKVTSHEELRSTTTVDPATTDNMSVVQVGERDVKQVSRLHEIRCKQMKEEKEVVYTRGNYKNFNRSPSPFKSMSCSTTISANSSHRSITKPTLEPPVAPKRGSLSSAYSSSGWFKRQDNHQLVRARAFSANCHSWQRQSAQPADEWQPTAGGGGQWPMNEQSKQQPQMERTTTRLQSGGDQQSSSVTTEAADTSCRYLDPAPQNGMPLKAEMRNFVNEQERDSSVHGYLQEKQNQHLEKKSEQSSNERKAPTEAASAAHNLSIARLLAEGVASIENATKTSSSSALTEKTKGSRQYEQSGEEGSSNLRLLVPTRSSAGGYAHERVAYESSAAGNIWQQREHLSSSALSVDSCSASNWRGGRSHAQCSALDLSPSAAGGGAAAADDDDDYPMTTTNPSVKDKYHYYSHSTSDNWLESLRGESQGQLRPPPVCVQRSEVSQPQQPRPSSSLAISNTKQEGGIRGVESSDVCAHWNQSERYGPKRPEVMTGDREVNHHHHHHHQRLIETSEVNLTSRASDSGNCTLRVSIMLPPHRMHRIVIYRRPKLNFATTINSR